MVDFAPTHPARGLEVVGVVEAWGTIHVHREGFRAQYAKPTTFFLIGAGRDSDYGRLVTDVAIGHHARVVELDAPAAIASWCGEAGVGLLPEEVDAMLSGSDLDAGPDRV